MNSELEGLAVFGETSVGWDAKTPVNETLDENGQPTDNNSFALADPRAPANRVYDDPEVEQLRNKLRQYNGLDNLEISSPDEVDRIARIFHRDGFVVVKDLLNTDQLNAFREASAEILQQLLSIPGHDGRKYVTESYRLPHRYSYGTASASRQMLHHPTWAEMVDLPTTTPLLAKIFAGMDYRVWGCGGDLCLPGAVEYQHLHADIAEDWKVTSERADHARRLGIEIPDEIDPKLHQRIVENACGFVTINFLMSDLTWENGPIRQIPGTHGISSPAPSQENEPEWMRHCTLVGATAGSGVIRDNRAWHGATPNLSREIRAMPNIEYVADWFPKDAIIKNMPHEIWETLTDHGRTICQDVKAEPGVWPKGAGIMHPTANQRRTARKTGKK